MQRWNPTTLRTVQYKSVKAFWKLGNAGNCENRETLEVLETLEFLKFRNYLYICGSPFFLSLPGSLDLRISRSHLLSICMSESLTLFISPFAFVNLWISRSPDI